MTGPYQQPGSWGPPPMPPTPPRKSQTGAIVGTVVGVVLMLGLGTWAVIGIISSRHSTEAAGTSSTSSTARTTTRPPRTTNTDSLRFNVNDCVWLDVKTSEGVSCTSDKAALQINLVIPQKDKCNDVDAYDSYGDSWFDGKLALRYCASLSVPKGQCVQLDLDDTGLVERASCTSTKPLAAGAPNAKTYQVTDIVTSTNPKTACDKVAGTDDVWFHQSPKSGQFACLKRLTG
ncbi:hypothetical protein [Kutzneria kofuensis]|uniref:Uncharacterized protein n=1 Tax=Kutzneria kofuensis TaxID=103725 RepID=A0A7W9KE64_9PSEU|nr:hypothetical protein [Kutzneria kofuensis]MBB5890800.1 hypothetical protein [Kutzneria kofuensis]